MKTMTKFALALLISIATIACQNPSPNANNALAESSTETTEATNAPAGFATLSFKMDGVLIEGTTPGVMAIYVPAKMEVNIRASTEKGLFEVIIDSVQGTGTYTIKGNSKNGAGLMMKTKMFEVKKRGTTFKVTIDAVEAIAANATTEAKAIRGTFEGNFMDEEGNIITITEGKFSSQ